jgi:prophage maintenance system killer protein
MHGELKSKHTFANGNERQCLVVYMEYACFGVGV